ncbi:NAD(P)/FAD-dependent oxidoreductase [Oceanobacillus jeddahense]|uniref:NAD(P)/FAD-dependent oxidoreductase n=1 Tax=Oceanobacillus jeddahense TaxID=1462527 RepID=UPI000595F266|nr:FAD-dependent oxidoreductase [Oceanobacillus jeddahense]
MKKVIIIGGGVIGLTSAYFLRKAGAEVTVIEKEEFGMACSKGNQGWVCPAIHEPVPTPGLVAESLQMLMKKDSPLYIKPSAMPQLSGWLTQFMKYCNETDFKKGEKALLTTSKHTLSLFDDIQKDGVDFELHKKGMLFVFLYEANLKKKLERLESVSQQYGHQKPEYKSKEEVKALEPALSDNVKGGIFLENQYHIRPESFSKGMVEKLKEMGVKLYSNTEVIDIEKQDNHITSIKTKDETFEANAFLLAAGAWSDDLGKKINYKLPLTAGKGYSITITNPKTELDHPLYLGDLKGGVTPFHHAVRIGGTMELSGKNLRLDKKRVQGIRYAVSQYLEEEIQGDNEEEWGGMRPMTPDGMPAIGGIPHLDNMYICTGHAMVGLAMAPVSGKMISEIILSGKTDFDMEAFSPARFEKS